MTILAYFADLLYADGTREEKWLTVNERNDLIGDGRIACATYIPAVRQCEGSWLHAPAWLLDYPAVRVAAITTREQAAMSAWQLGVTVTPLQFASKGSET